MSGALLFCLSALGGPLVIAAVVLAIALTLVLPAGTSAGWGVVAGVPLVLSAPLAALVAGRLASAFAEGYSGEALEKGAFVLGLSAWLGSDLSAESVRSLAEVLTGADPSRAAALVTGAISAALFSGGLVALSLICCCLAIEVPAAWICEGLGLRIATLLPAFRPALLLLAASLGANLIVSLFLDEMHPFSIARRWISP